MTDFPSQYCLIAGQCPELHEEAARVERFALADPRTACFYARRTIELLVEWVYANDSLLQRPWGEPSLSQLIHAFDFRQLVGPQLLGRFKLLKDLGNDAVHRAQPIRWLQAGPRRQAEKETTAFENAWSKQ
ncbi:DUF4145 domain-containing protein [Synechococcus sp. CS-1328]|uniref:DUF4145 domain-containing protein n=1 Tax=Synechococcus sp. CS-1328 TaxID=2847976 RepID=UPI00223BC0B4|nr:DUF4145 domain-containing protein [Synechococcus sp. CS-1328]MCT0224615.1 DUF4145 domain-containing protein [Synechococcus sp. CS-1328]